MTLWKRYESQLRGISWFSGIRTTLISYNWEATGRSMLKMKTSKRLPPFQRSWKNTPKVVTATRTTNLVTPVLMESVPFRSKRHRNQLWTSKAIWLLRVIPPIRPCLRPLQNKTKGTVLKTEAHQSVRQMLKRLKNQLPLQVNWKKKTHRSSIWSKAVKAKSRKTTTTKVCQRTLTLSANAHKSTSFNPVVFQTP